MCEFISELKVGDLQLGVVCNSVSVKKLILNPSLDGQTENAVSREAVKQISEYWQGIRQFFTLNLDPDDTNFEKLVWRALCDIPYGQTTTYQQLARQIDNPQAVRAVGRANGKNPIPIIIPCHRVIGSNNSLVGFSLGIEIKKKLLNLENASGIGGQVLLNW